MLVKLEVFASLGGELPIVSLQQWNEVATTGAISLDVEQFGVCISRAQPHHPRTLVNPDALNKSHTKELMLNVLSEADVSTGEISVVLRLIRSKDNMVSSGR